MALSNISKEHQNALLEVINSKEDDTLREKVVFRSNIKAQLRFLIQQRNLIDKQIQELVENSVDSIKINNLETRFKKVTGSVYHLYLRHDEDTPHLSILSPDEFGDSIKDKQTHLGSYRYNEDYSWSRLESKGKN